MKRTPTTNPKIDGKPMSFVRLGSRFETPLRLVVKTGLLTRERRYTQDEKGTIRRVREANSRKDGE